MRGGIEMRGLLCDPFAELLELILHVDWISWQSDIVASGYRQSLDIQVSRETIALTVSF